MRVITFGTFDLFHIGHLNVLKRARELGDELFVGLSSDELNFSKKGRYPIYPFVQRAALLSNLRCVDYVFSEDSLDLKVDYIKQHKADVLVMGDDWAGKFDFCAPYCKVVYLPRTPSISTTEIIEIIREL
jgi:glycerol-3-phosphate cytidylyltransferase